jgi:hypothetical protein
MTAHHPVPFALPIVLALVLAPSLPVAAVESGWYDSVDGTYRVRVPELLTGPIEISAECPNPSITCQVMFTQFSGWYAGITSTRIRPDYPKDDSLLDRIEAGQTRRWGSLVQGNRIVSYPVGNGLTYRLRIEEGGSGVLETREKDGSVIGRAPDLFAVAVFVVKNGYLYEFDYAIPQPGPEEVFPSSSVFDLAEENVRKFMSGFTPVTPSE